jgi:hypothetical protein
MKIELKKKGFVKKGKKNKSKTVKNLANTAK